jgi:sec-independent protein translocase protein TatA
MPLGPWELVIILLIVVVIFGAGRLSEIGGAFGKSIKEFRNATRDEPPATTPPAVAPPAAPTVTTAAASPVAQTTCSACNAVNPADKTFCGQCGARLTVPV